MHIKKGQGGLKLVPFDAAIKKIYPHAELDEKLQTLKEGVRLRHSNKE
ncbi:MAG: hypothetical protein GKR87_11145 [Kiritimatiellae bacterium]|nr:hypothetical protein [Kiritimatiellia bacterium]